MEAQRIPPWPLQPKREADKQDGVPGHDGTKGLGFSGLGFGV